MHRCVRTFATLSAFCAAGCQAELGTLNELIASGETQSEVIIIQKGALNVDDDGDGFTENQGDCNDWLANIHPGATEVCTTGTFNGYPYDEDCDGLNDTDDPSATGVAVVYPDVDYDRHGDSAAPSSKICDFLVDFYPVSRDNLDCDDTNPSLNFLYNYYLDPDGDCSSDIPLFAVPQCVIAMCGEYEGQLVTSWSSYDCEPNDPLINPYRAEDCLTEVDEDCKPNDDPSGSYTNGVLLFVDEDGDAFGAQDAEGLFGCLGPGYATNDLDCDDSPIGCGADCAPQRREACDLLDNDCSGLVDDVVAPGTTDFDSDGVSDCSDNCRLMANALQLDTNADGIGDVCSGDDDGDGYVEADAVSANDPNTHSGAVEICDGVDNDLDGRIDEDTGCSPCSL